MGDHAASRSGVGAAGEMTDDAVVRERGRLLFAASCDFVHAATRSDDLPSVGASEIAFAGRSNVGKSSLVNALTGRRTLARVSKEPGRTRQLNFFRLGPDARGARLMLVDMPGYGFARAPKPLLKEWGALIGNYLVGRAALRRVLVLIDARFGPKMQDRELFAMLDRAAVSWQLVLTKCDQLGEAALAARHAETLAELAQHVAAHPQLIMTSSRDGVGIEELRASLATLATIG
jgi:GTP-binding protein